MLDTVKIKREMLSEMKEKEKEEKEQLKQTVEKECNLFGQLVSSKLASMNEKQREFAQGQIMAALFNIQSQPAIYIPEETLQQVPTGSITNLRPFHPNQENER